MIETNKKVSFVTVIEDKELYLQFAKMLILSLRLHGGTIAAASEFIVCFIGDARKKSCDEFRSIPNVSTVAFDAAFEKDFFVGNILLYTGLQFGTDMVVYIDADCFVTGDISDYLHRAMTEDRILSSLPGFLPNSKLVRALYKKLEIEPFDDNRFKDNLPYFNTGVVMIPSSCINKLGDIWISIASIITEILRASNLSNLLYWAEQLAFPVAIKALGFQYDILDLRCNYREDASHFYNLSIPIDEARLIHYVSSWWRPDKPFFLVPDGIGSFGLPHEETHPVAAIFSDVLASLYKDNPSLFEERVNTRETESQAHTVYVHDSCSNLFTKAGRKISTPEKCLIVLGMHRSGTSALMGTLQQLGVDVGNIDNKPQIDNEKGHFENHAIYLLNNRILTLLDSQWDSPAFFPDRWWRSDEMIKLKDTIVSIVRRDYTSSLIAFKDPRISLLLPLWFSVLDDMNIEPYFVISIRHPLEVAGSLKRRDNFPEKKSLILWQRYLLDAEYNSRGCPRTFVKYSELLASPIETLEMISNILGIDFPGGIKTRDSALKNFLDRKLRHHSCIGTDCDGSMSGTYGLYSLACKAANSNGYEDELLGGFNEYRQDFFGGAKNVL